MKITIDTNIIPADEIIEICKRKNYQYACISVTRRELQGTSFEKELQNTSITLETGVYNESEYGQACYGSKNDSNMLEDILNIISNGSFPKNRENLSKGFRRMLRDAMILQAHIRNKRDVFISNDERAFIQIDRRNKLKNKFNITILTKDEFIKINS